MKPISCFWGELHEKKKKTSVHPSLIWVSSTVLFKEQRCAMTAENGLGQRERGKTESSEEEHAGSLYSASP